MDVVIDLMEHMHFSLKVRKGGIICCRCSIMCLIALECRRMRERWEWSLKEGMSTARNMNGFDLIKPLKQSQVSH